MDAKIQHFVRTHKSAVERFTSLSMLLAMIGNLIPGIAIPGLLAAFCFFASLFYLMRVFKWDAFNW